MWFSIAFLKYQRVFEPVSSHQTPKYPKFIRKRQEDPPAPSNSSGPQTGGPLQRRPARIAAALGGAIRGNSEWQGHLLSIISSFDIPSGT